MKKNKFENVVVLPRESVLGNFFDEINFAEYSFSTEIKNIVCSVDNLIKTNNWAVSFLLLVFILVSIFTSFIF